MRIWALLHFVPQRFLVNPNATGDLYGFFAELSPQYADYKYQWHSILLTTFWTVECPSVLPMDWIT